jgi:hypothetical protein
MKQKWWLGTAVLVLRSFLGLICVGQVVAASDVWIPTGSMTEPRRDHRAALMNDGRVLVVGGLSATGEIYDPVSGTFTSAGDTIFFHGLDPTATTLADGRVLITGGNGASMSAEIYDPVTDAFSPTGGMNRARFNHTATLLSNGQVLIVGGKASIVSENVAVAELFDPATGTFTLTGALNEARDGQTATLLPSKLVLIVAGLQNTQQGFARTLFSAELYNPILGTFSPTGNVIGARVGHTASLLPTGQVLIAGGTSGTVKQRSNLYDPMTGSFSLTGEMITKRSSHTAVQLPSTESCLGLTLVAGGSIAVGPVVTESAELYDPVLGIFTETAPMNSPRQQFTATLLLDGRVLVAGGFDGSTNTNSAELIDLSGVCKDDFVVIDGCETGVPNQVVVDQHTIADLILQCAAGTTNHGQFVSCVAHLTNGLKKTGMISGQDKGAIMSCAGQAAIP